MVLGILIQEILVKRNLLRTIRSSIDSAAQSIETEVNLLKRDTVGRSMFDDTDYREIVIRQVRGTYQYGLEVINRHSKNYIKQYDKYFGKSRQEFFKAGAEFEAQFRRWQPNFELYPASLAQ